MPWTLTSTFKQPSPFSEPPFRVQEFPGVLGIFQPQTYMHTLATSLHCFNFVPPSPHLKPYAHSFYHPLPLTSQFFNGYVTTLTTFFTSFCCFHVVFELSIPSFILVIFVLTTSFVLILHILTNGVVCPHILGFYPFCPRIIFIISSSASPQFHPCLH